jgi:hypothetical protein
MEIKYAKRAKHLHRTQVQVSVGDYPSLATGNTEVTENQYFFSVCPVRPVAVWNFGYSPEISHCKIKRAIL